MTDYYSMIDTNIKWVGKIPKHWNASKLKYVSVIETGTTPSTSNEDYYLSGETLWVKPDDLNEFISITTSKQKLTSQGVKVSRPLKPKSALVCSIGSIGKFGFSHELVCTNQQINGVTFNEKMINNRYGLYLISSLKDEFVRLSEKVVVSILNKTKQENTLIPVPPLKEQKLISRYLDKKTKQIDSLIEKIQKKINLLKEQRTSLINQCVTKGINPNVEMKDSGVEWIGGIPKHWGIKKLKYFSSVELSSVDRHEYDNEIRVTICHYPDVYKNEYIDRETLLPSGTCSNNELNKFSLRKGDILLTKDSESPDDIGVPTLILEDLKNTVCGYHLAVVRTDNLEVISDYLYRYIESETVRNYFSISSNGITRFGLGKGSIENLWVPMPPIKEQEKIVNQITNISSPIKSISDRLLKQVELLKEYRQSLISSAVTGKFRVTEDMI